MISSTLELQFYSNQGICPITDINTDNWSTHIVSGQEENPASLA